MGQREELERNNITIMDHLSDIFVKMPAQAYYAAIAAAGGIARYLNSYKEGGTHFSFAIFCASAFVAGFSGLMFALLGDSLLMPNPIPHIMAGVGGFFGDQTMKFLFEYLSKKKMGK